MMYGYEIWNEKSSEVMACETGFATSKEAHEAGEARLGGIAVECGCVIDSDYVFVEVVHN